MNSLRGILNAFLLYSLNHITRFTLIIFNTILSYASSALHRGSPQSHMHVLQRTQHSILLIATRWTRSTPTAPFHADTKLFCLKYYLDLWVPQTFSASAAIELPLHDGLHNPLGTRGAYIEHLVHTTWLCSAYYDSSVSDSKLPRLSGESHSSFQKCPKLTGEQVEVGVSIPRDAWDEHEIALGFIRVIWLFQVSIRRLQWLPNQ